MSEVINTSLYSQSIMLFHGESTYILPQIICKGSALTAICIMAQSWLKAVWSYLKPHSPFFNLHLCASTLLRTHL